MATDSYLVPPSQYHVLENFSPMEADNVNDLVKILSMNELLRNIPLTVPIAFENGVVPETLTERYYDLSINGVNVDVSPGLCICKSVMIDMTSIKTINVTDDDSYLGIAQGDSVPTSPGSYTLMVGLYYNPNDIRPDAYVGFINNFAYYYANYEDIVILGFADLTISGGYTIDAVKDSDSVSGLYRKNYDTIDSGTL